MKKAILVVLVGSFLMIPFMAGNHTGVRTFALVFLSILLEALPFMLLGSCVGGLIEVFISRERLLAWLPKQALHVTCVAGGSRDRLPGL